MWARQFVLRPLSKPVARPRLRQSASPAGKAPPRCLSSLHGPRVGEGDEQRVQRVWVGRPHPMTLGTDTWRISRAAFFPPSTYAHDGRQGITKGSIAWVSGTGGQAGTCPCARWQCSHLRIKAAHPHTLHGYSRCDEQGCPSCKRESQPVSGLDNLLS